MGERSQRRKYRRRRQQAGFVLLVSFVIVVLGGLMFTGLDPLQRAPEPVNEVAPVELANAPEAIEEPEMVAVPDIPYNATEDEARKMLEESGLELGEVQKKPNDEYEEGGVFYQDPLPGVEVKEGSRVGITLSSGPQKEKKEAGDGALPPAPNDPTMYLTIPKLGLYDNTVYNDSSPATLDVGAAKIPSTGFPWQDNANPYIAGHRIGYAGTESYYQFYELPSMQKGDEVILEDANGSVYTYEVTKIFAVMPQDSWVTEPIPGKDMVTLQTCVASLNDWWTITPGLLTSPPGPETARLIVRAERVDVKPA